MSLWMWVAVGIVSKMRKLKSEWMRRACPGLCSGRARNPQAFCPGLFQPQEVSASGYECATVTWNVKVKVAQSFLTLCHPMDCTIHGILQARILEWVAFPFSRGSSATKGSNLGLLHCRWMPYQLSHEGSPSPRILEWVAYPFSNGSSQPGI